MSESTIINKTNNDNAEISLDNRIEIIEEGLRKKYLSRLTEMEIVPVGDLPDLESDLIDNVRLFNITEMVYQKGEPATDKFTTVFNTLATYNASVFVIIDSNGVKTNFYVGVRNNESDDTVKRSTVTLGDTLKNTLIGHFPGVKISNVDRSKITELSNKIIKQNNMTSVSVVGNSKSENPEGDEHFVQGIEKLALALTGRQYIGIFVAQNQSPQSVQVMRRNYEELYTKLSPYQSVQTSLNETTSESRNKSFSEMNGKQKAATIAGSLMSIGGTVAGIFAGVATGGASAAASAAAAASINTGAGMLGGQIGGQVGGQLNSFISSLAPVEQMSTSNSQSETRTVENKQVTDMLKLIDGQLDRLEEFDSYGMWNVAGYFISDDMSATEIAASNYRSLMNGEKSGREVSAINSWRRNNPYQLGDFSDLTTYLSRFVHPQFYYGHSKDRAIITNASTEISGKELGLHLGLPRMSVPGLPVIEHAEFGKEVYRYQLFSRDDRVDNPEDRLTLGKVFDLGQITDKVVELNNKTLNMHTFITGSTGSGKSNCVYQMLTELYQDKIPFLVIEPAKGEYKDVFGNWPDVNVYSTNPKISELININPFKFPESIHVLEHVDGLVEIFSVCWPMYDAMPAFFKDAILKSYESVGWDLGSSTFYGDTIEYPDFETLAEQLEELINSSDYASDIKSNYKGALITRVKSLTVGLNRFIFTKEQTPYEELFDKNCIIDVSRVKSTETTALIMGLIVYILNEYRTDRKLAHNMECNHITVLEEAHNLLKNTSGSQESELISKSVQMLTNSIAEMRACGEGFIIVDQSPSSVDIAAIKNTNTKIVLRTPEANDREAVGRSMGLTEDQVNEIAKLPKGVAVVYQNDWVNPVLTMIDRASVDDTDIYRAQTKMVIVPMRTARTVIVKMLMQPWFGNKKYSREELMDALKVMSLTRKDRAAVESYIDKYCLFGGSLIWKKEDMAKLSALINSILEIHDKDYENNRTPTAFKSYVGDKLIKLSPKELEKICYVLTYSEEG